MSSPSPAQSGSDTPRSRTDWATNQLRSDILAGALPAGARLQSRDLAGRYRISPTPVREALQRLAAEGLVTIEPQRGARVAPLDPFELRCLYELRLMLEPKAVARSVSQITDSRIAEMNDAYQAMEHAATEDEYWVRHNAFHALTRIDCDSAWMLRVVDMLLVNGERYRRLRAGTGLVQARHEHSELLHACQARDADRAADLTEVQLQNTLEAALRALEAGDSREKKEKVVAPRRRA
jgi:DNA-binding GntR family transcriptional regulator